MISTDLPTLAITWYARKHFSGNREMAAYWINWYCHHTSPSTMSKECIDPDIERFCQSTALMAI